MVEEKNEIPIAEENIEILRLSFEGEEIITFMQNDLDTFLDTFLDNGFLPQRIDILMNRVETEEKKEEEKEMEEVKKIKCLRFSHLYDKLRENEGTTIRMSLKDKKTNEILRVGDIVEMAHYPNIRFKAKITKIDYIRIKDIPLPILKKDISPFECESYEEFVEFLKDFYDFPFYIDKYVYVIYWRVDL